MFDIINISNHFSTNLETYDLKYLLKLATIIQKNIKHEHDADIKNSLKNDLKIVKAQIGNQVLDMPEDQIVFPPIKVTHYSAVNSPIQKIPVKRISNSSKSVALDFSEDDLAAKFESFLEQREKQNQLDDNFNNKTTKKTQTNLGKRKSKKHKKKRY